MRRVALLLAMSVPAAALRAAPLADDDRLLQPRHSRPDRVGVGAAASALERALQVESSAGQRNLELLLETRGSGDLAVDPTARRRAQTALAPLSGPGQSPGGANAVSARPVPGAPVTPSPRLLAHVTEAGLSGAGGALAEGPGREVAPARREWLGAVGNGTGAATQADRHAGLLALTAEQGDARRTGEAADGGGVLREDIQRVLDFLREHRWLLFGGAVVLVIGQLVLQAIVRSLQRSSTRPAARTPPPAARDTLALPGVHGRRRRSSHRR